MAKKSQAEPVLPLGWRLDKRGTPFYDIVEPKTGALLIRVGKYSDPIIDKPEGMARFLDFLPVFLRDVEKGKWASLALDSGSFTTLSARKYHQYDLNSDAKDPRQWYGGATDMAEEILCVQLPAMPCNVGVAMHVSKEKVEAEGTMVRAPLAPGRLLNMVGAAWPELYRLHVLTNDAGKKFRVFQTDSDDRWQAGTTIDAPDDTRVYRLDPAKTWESLWVNWPSKDRPFWHGLCYGEPHSGKSTALCMLPKPLYVAMFDAVGKDAPYRRQGVLKL
jgi:hypothetical protein